MKPKIAFVFPGQGSQALGLLSALAAFSPIIQQTFEIASEVLGKDLWQLAQSGPALMLNQTVWTQPVLLAAGVAVWRLWIAQGGQLPDFLAGHSLGEYTALTCAGSLELTDAIQLVANRGRYMQAAVPEGEGAMAAIVGLSDQQVCDVCGQATTADTQVSPANYNMPGQIVVSGHSQAVDCAVQLAKQAGAKLAKRIPVSVPAHCDLMRSAAQQLHHDLSQLNFQPPKIPVVNNVTAVVAHTPDGIKQALVKQLYSPVQWIKSIQWLQMQGVNYFIECGPGKVLSNLIKRMSPAEVTVMPIEDPINFHNALDLLRK